MLLIQLNSKRSEMPYVETQPRPPAPRSQVHLPVTSKKNGQQGLIVINSYKHI